MKMAERRPDTEGIDLEGNYSVEELNDFVSVMRKLSRVRDIVLTVNDQYIRRPPKLMRIALSLRSSCKAPTAI